MERRCFLQLSAAVLIPPQKPPTESATATATQDRTPRVAIILSDFPEALLRQAIELSNTRTGGLPSIVGPEDRVVIQTAPGVDPRLVQSLQTFLTEQGRGRRFTVVSLAELANADTEEMPVPGTERVCRVPKLIVQCDRLIRIAPLTAVKPDVPAQELVDRMSFHPPDYTILTAQDLIVAGADPVAVESVAAQILGLDPEKLPHLRLAAERGLGVWEPGSIWTRGNTVDEARAAVQHASPGTTSPR